MTIKEIASLAGVSPSTVSKIMNHKDDDINIETRNRVLKIVKDYNYTPYASAILSSTNKTFLLGVLVANSSQNQLMIQGILESAQERGYRVILCQHLNSQEEEHKNIAALKHSRVDGVIWEPVSKESLSHQHYFTSADIPIRFINTTADDSACSIDFSKLGYEATQVLIDCGHRQLAFLSQSDSLRSGMALDGFKRCLFDNKITFFEEMVLPEAPACYLKSIHTNQFTGLVSSHFTCALNFCEKYRTLQYQIPSDFSLISLRDDLKETTSCSHISCIKIPYYEFGYFLGKEMIELSEKNQLEISKFETTCMLESKTSIDKPFTSKKANMIVIGSINIDVTLNVEDLPKPGQTVSTDYASITPGGKGINQSVGVAKLNHPVSLIGRVGNDYEASIIYETLSEHHVDCTGIKRKLQTQTGKAYIQVQKDGESTITVLTGANRLLSQNDIKSQSRLFQNTTFCLLQTEVPVKAVKEAAKMANAFGILTILKPATIKTIDKTFLECIDYFIPNEKEAHTLCPMEKDTEGMADYFLALGAKNVIITLGERGCFVKNAQTAFHTPAVSTETVDTTGAADAFISALAVYLSSGYPLEKSVRIATYAASFCVNRQGVVPALIDRNSLELSLKRKEPGLL